MYMTSCELFWTPVYVYFTGMFTHLAKKPGPPNTFFMESGNYKNCLWSQIFRLVRHPHGNVHYNVHLINTQNEYINNELVHNITRTETAVISKAHSLSIHPRPGSSDRNYLPTFVSRCKILSSDPSAKEKEIKFTPFDLPHRNIHTMGL